MATWVLVPCLISLRDELNELAPGRDKASDGSIGDQRHASSSSDHNPDETGATPYEDADSKNEVHAVDVDKDLRKSGWNMAKVVQAIVMRHRRGQDDRLQNVIYDRAIWSRSWGWTAREYNGSNAHTEHAHFSSRYTTAQENDTSEWGLLAIEREEEYDGMAEISQARFTELLHDALHSGEIGRSGQTFAQALDQVDQVLAVARANATALSAVSSTLTAYVNAEQVEDNALRAAVSDLSVVASDIQSTLEQIDNRLPVEQSTTPDN